MNISKKVCILVPRFPPLRFWPCRGFSCRPISFRWSSTRPVTFLLVLYRNVAGWSCLMAGPTGVTEDYAWAESNALVQRAPVGRHQRRDTEGLAAVSDRLGPRQQAHHVVLPQRPNSSLRRSRVLEAVHHPLGRQRRLRQNDHCWTRGVP